MSPEKERELLSRMVEKTRTIDRLRRELRKIAPLAAPPLADRLRELADSVDRRRSKAWERIK